MRQRRSRRGISLVEVMVVIAIILTVTSVLAIGIMGAYQRSLVDVTQLTMGKVGETVELQRMRTRTLPTSIDGLGLEPQARFDGWGQPIALNAPGRDGAPYELVSLGRDGREGGTGYDEDLVWRPSGG